ncbi:MAG: hypothetical protein PHQ74_13480 [Crocinitomicaceae bacterium]|nr:hypothetical protein [Crocinitomicaceae bacterium]
MRIVKFISTTLFLILFLGCKKAQPVPNYFSFLVGEYEWSYSTTGDIKNANSSKSSYGIRIDKTGYLYTFKDGKKLDKYKIEKYKDLNTFITYTKNEISIKGRIEKFENGQKEIVISYFPNETNDISNYFLDYE